LYVVPAVGGSPRPLVADALGSSFPIWSPDSSSLLVLTSQSVFGGVGSRDWRVVSLSGTDRGPTDAFEAIGRSSAASLSGSYIADLWDAEGFVYFSSRHINGDGLWRILVSPESGKAKGEPQAVMTGPGTFRGASLANDGRLVFAAIEENEDIWSLAIDADRGVALTAEPERLMNSSADEGGANLSLEGDVMLFWSSRSGSPGRYVYDFAAKREHSVGPWLRNAALNAAGTLFAERRESGLAIVTLDGIVKKEIPYPGPSMPWGWSPDDSFLLMNRLKGTQRPIFLLDIDSGKETELLSDPDKSFAQGQFSPDGRWIAWMTIEDGVQVARFHGAQAIAESERIQVSEPGRYADKPRWSPDGNLLYHTSDRDGFHCIYAQPLDPDTKQPQGELLEIYHSHQARLSMGIIHKQEIDVARDKIVFAMTELRANIWMMVPAVP